MIVTERAEVQCSQICARMLIVFVRYQSPTPGKRGVHTGVFGLINTLGRAGKLSDQEYRDWRCGNDWFTRTVTDPSDVDPAVYDEHLHPRAKAWFKSDAAHLLVHLERHLQILRNHGVACVRIDSANPGITIYEDDVQIVVDPLDPRAMTSYHPSGSLQSERAGRRAPGV